MKYQPGQIRPGTRRWAIIVPVESFAGAAVTDIAADMLTLAMHLGMPVSSNVNGCRLLAFPGGTMADIEKDYKRQLEADEPQ